MNLLLGAVLVGQIVVLALVFLALALVLRARAALSQFAFGQENHKQDVAILLTNLKELNSHRTECDGMLAKLHDALAISSEAINARLSEIMILISNNEAQRVEETRQRESRLRIIDTLLEIISSKSFEIHGANGAAPKSATFSH
jgi:hypothetical protein